LPPAVVQGRLFLSDESVCFYSAFLKKPVAFKYADIAAVHKHRSAGLPQALVYAINRCHVAPALHKGCYLSALS
jgi:hypothetical protein